jgi:hypothetical protein
LPKGRLLRRPKRPKNPEGPSPALPYYHFAKGLAEYRAGNFQAAVSILTGDAAKVLQPAPQLVTAMARFRLGQVREAREGLARAIDSFDRSPKRAHAADRREAWINHILRREVDTLIRPPEPKSGKSKTKICPESWGRRIDGKSRVCKPGFLRALQNRGDKI